MAYGDSYASVLELEERLGRSDDGSFAELLDAASRRVEDFCRRQFNRDTATTPVATARRFRALDPERLPVDDFRTTTDLAIEVDGTAWATTDVDPRPWDGVYKGRSGWPYSDLIAVGRSWPDSRRALIEVTAHWGWTAVPEAIRQATLDVAEAAASGSATGVVRSEAIDGYSVTYAATSDSTVPPELAKAAPYRRVRFGIG